MATVGTTRMSCRGQVVIPQGIRNEMGLRAGTPFVILSSARAIVLRPVEAPSMEEFDSLIRKARTQARRARVRPAEVLAAVRRARKAR